jgi:hypothetical protein
MGVLYFSGYRDNFQVAIYPNVSTVMFIADAAAIKVSLKLLCNDMILIFAGSHLIVPNQLNS